MGDKPRLDPDLVKDFVGSAHGNLERVMALVCAHPALANASWDWGGGDWETGLGAAAHTGRRDIARFLIEHGARMDVFAAAMLGHLDLVRAHLAALPAALDTPGPHGIPLIAHAKMGGEAATPVLDYLEGLQAARSAFIPPKGAGSG